MALSTVVFWTGVYDVFNGAKVWLAAAGVLLLLLAPGGRHD